MNLKEAYADIAKHGMSNSFPEGALVLAGNRWTVCVNGKLRTAMNKVVNVKRGLYSCTPATYVVPANVYTDPSTPEYAVRQEIMTCLTVKACRLPAAGYNPLLTNVKPVDGDLVIVCAYYGHVDSQHFCVMADGLLFFNNGAHMTATNTKRRVYPVPKSVYMDPTTPEHAIYVETAKAAVNAAAKLKAEGFEHIRTGMATATVTDERAMAALSLMTDNVKRVKVRANVWLKPDGTRTAKLFLHVYPKTGACSRFGDITRRFTPKDVTSGVGFAKALQRRTKNAAAVVEPVLTMLVPMVDLDTIGTRLLTDAWAIAENY
jgi:hypothetical protein